MSVFLMSTPQVCSGTFSSRRKVALLCNGNIHQRHQQQKQQQQWPTIVRLCASTAESYPQLTHMSPPDLNPLPTNPVSPTLPRPTHTTSITPSWNPPLTLSIHPPTPHQYKFNTPPPTVEEQVIHLRHATHTRSPGPHFGTPTSPPPTALSPRPILAPPPPCSLTHPHAPLRCTLNPPCMGPCPTHRYYKHHPLLQTPLLPPPPPPHHTTYNPQTRKHNPTYH